MSEKKDEKKEDKKEEKKEHHTEGISGKRALLLDILTMIFGEPIARRVLVGLWTMWTHKMERVAERPQHMVSFGEALVKLNQVDQRAYDVIRDFMAVELTRDADRNDFQVRTAKMGGANVDTTVAFLRLVAAEPDHRSRKEFLEEMGIIGSRAMEPIERIALFFNRMVKNIDTSNWKENWQKAGVKFDDWLAADIQRQRAIRERLERELDDNPLPPPFFTGLRQKWQAWQTRRRTEAPVRHARREARQNRRREIWRERWSRFQQWLETRRQKRHERWLRFREMLGNLRLTLKQRYQARIERMQIAHGMGIRKREALEVIRQRRAQEKKERLEARETARLARTWQKERTKQVRLNRPRRRFHFNFGIRTR